MRRQWCSEWDAMEHDPITNEPVMVPGYRDTYFLAKTVRPKPGWIDKIKDNRLSDILYELYGALDHGLRMSAAIATRTAIDHLMNDFVGDQGSFFNTLKQMEVQQFIGESERVVLTIMVDVGSAAAHRGHTPSVKDLNVVISTMERLIEFHFFIRPSAESVKQSTPKRPKRRKAKKESK